MLDTRLLAYDYYVGFDIGKFDHHVIVIRGSDQKTVLSKQVAQDEKKIQETLSAFSAKGRVLVAVDQKGSIGRLVTSVAKGLGVDVGFLTPADFHHFAEGYTEVKTDAVDAFEISDLSMRMTHVLFSVEEAHEAMESLRLLCTRRGDRPLSYCSTLRSPCCPFICWPIAYYSRHKWYVPFMSVPFMSVI